VAAIQSIKELSINEPTMTAKREGDGGSFHHTSLILMGGVEADQDG
jgi:hypothetical protein